MIQRLARTVKLCRKTLETLYRSYIRGYMNYGMAIWGSACKTYQEKIHTADRAGLRMVCGAIACTPTLELHRESNFMTLEQQIKKQTLKLTLKYFDCPTFLDAKRKLSRPDKIPTKSVMGRMIQLWIDYYLPLDFIGNHGQIQLVKETLKQFAIKVDHTKYRGDFWEERLLARIRMGVLPTKKWALRLGLEQNSCCRHCKLDEETAQHCFWNAR